MAGTDDIIRIDAGLRLSRTGRLFRDTGQTIFNAPRATVPGPQAYAYAYAYSNAYAYAYSQSPAAQSGMVGAPAGAPALNGDSVPAFGDQVISTWRELRELALTRRETKLGDDSVEHGRDFYGYENLDMPPPPDRDATEDEITELHRKEARLRDDEFRQKEIVRQVAANNPADMLRRLGIEELKGFDATRGLIATVLQLSERVGYVYKSKFNRTRPSQMDPTLRPFIGIPPHPAYPSNHAFQSTCVALVLSRAIPELTPVQELFHVAQRIAENREFAGLHYKSDTEEGVALAGRFAPYLFNVCRYQMRAAQREWYQRER